MPNVNKVTNSWNWRWCIETKEGIKARIERGFYSLSNNDYTVFQTRKDAQETLAMLSEIDSFKGARVKREV